jgi:hypothetical protein
VPGIDNDKKIYKRKMTKRDREQLSLCHSTMLTRSGMPIINEKTLRSQSDDVDKIIIF